MVQVTDTLVFEGLPSEIEQMARQIETEIRKDPNYAELVVRWLADHGIASSRDPAEDARLFATIMAQNPENDPDKALNAMGELMGVIALTGLGVIGIFEPTPIADGAAVGVSLAMMRYSKWYFVDAALSGVGVIPYLGDAVGKPFFLARMASRIDDITRVLNRASGAAGAHVRRAIEAIKNGENIPRLPPGVVAVAAKAASTSSRALDDIIADLRKIPTVPYGRMGALKRYMAKRGVAVYDGAQGAAALDKMGHPNAFGMFLVMRNDQGREVTGFIFRGEPSRAVVHHELWHRNEFVRQYGGSFDRWAEANRGAGKWARERYVHERMTGAGSVRPERGQQRWNSYNNSERLEQTLYNEENTAREAMEALGDIMASLEKMGIRSP
jgi:hypothetical protein